MTGTQACMDFDGKTFDKEKDGARLRRQLSVVFDVMACGEYFTLAEIAEQTGFPEASISARLRDLRKDKFGGHSVNRRRRPIGDMFGTWEYSLTVNNG